MERRELFRVLIAGAAAVHDVRGQHHHAELNAPPEVAVYKPRFFSKPEYAAVQGLCDVLIPPDGQSPGASEAGVGFYIDTILLYGVTDAREIWRSGLRLVDETAKTRLAKPFVECSQREQEQIVALMAHNEAKPRTELEKFFVTLKGAVVEAYVLSEPGMRAYLGYKGDTMLTEFPGCRDHQI